MKAAYKDADGLKIMGRRIVVDVERGRTVKGWKPKRLGKDKPMIHLLSIFITETYSKVNHLTMLLYVNNVK